MEKCDGKKLMRQMYQKKRKKKSGIPIGEGLLNRKGQGKDEVR